ncbi:MAG: tetratricopeptide repeat protein [Phycisphaerales bacterium]|nr:MAG: tetratricopeptide repeat protein [Phycisphaerales bacterium]
MRCKSVRMVTAAALLATVVGANVMKADLVAYWKLDDARGTKAIESVAGRNGELSGGAAWVKGHLGGALEFDGTDDHVDCGGGKEKGDPNTWADISGPITIAAWIKVNTFTKEWQTIISKGDRSWRLARNGKKNSVEFAANWLDTLWSVRGNVNVNDGKWHHVAGIYNGSTAFLYVDGKLDGLQPNSRRIASDNFDVCIGENLEKRGRQWNGVIDEVVIFNHALSRDELEQLCKLGGESFLSEELRMFGGLVQEAEKALAEKKPKDAVGFIAQKIAEYKRLQGKSPAKVGDTTAILSARLQFALAKAREASGTPRAQVLSAYRESALQSCKAPNYVPALVWLFQNMPAADYMDVVRRGMQPALGSSGNIGRIVASFEIAGHWDAFKLFLDATIPHADDATTFAEMVAGNLQADGVWSKKFRQYCRGEAALQPYVVKDSEKLAVEAVAQGSFAKAAELYRDIAGRCPPDQKMGYELKICECLFSSGQSAETVSETERFIKKYKILNRPMVIQATLLKGRALLQQGETDSASDVLLDLMIDYPEAKKAPEAHFFVGYCGMMQKKYKEARETFQHVIKNYPDSPYASKAALCIRRIDRIIN